MSVEVKEYAQITDRYGQLHEGEVTGTNIVEIDDNGTPTYGVAIKVTKVRVKVTCDNDKCENSTVGEDFVTHPKIVEYDQDKAEHNIDDISKLVIVTDYKGTKSTFCTADCYSSYARRKAREQFEQQTAPHGKGPREVLV